MNGTAVTNRLQYSFKITCTDHRIIEILGLLPSNRLPVSYYQNVHRNVKLTLRTQLYCIITYRILKNTFFRTHILTY
jgi:hypothetical protein